MKDVNLGKTQSPVSPQQRRQWWLDSHQNDAHSIYFLMIPTMLVTSHTDLELCGFDVNYVPGLSKYSITCISSMKKTVVVDSHQNNAHSVYVLMMSKLLVKSFGGLPL